MTITSQQVDAWDAEVDAAYASGVAAGAAREQRPWVGLTDEETVEAAWPLLTVKGLSNYKEYARAIEAKLKEKNT